MKRQAIEVNGESFATKAALKERIQGILYAHRPEHWIELPDSEFLAALLARHPRAAAKVGPGIDQFFVRLHPCFGKQRCFWLRRVDGSETDWSFLECITPMDARKKFTSAARSAIAYQVVAFKRRELNDSIVCPVTGDRVSLAEAHVDHQEPWTFEAILDAFIHEFSIDVHSFEIEGDGDGQLTDHFVDKDIEIVWRTFHAEKACLRLVSPKANLSILRRRA